MNVSFESPKPEIRILCKNNLVSQKRAKIISLGIEEEGVPYVITESPDAASGMHLAYKAAESSHLGVGIGVADNIALHYIKLKEDSPLFNIKSTDNEDTLRALGANAARLVKRMPFKSVQ